MLAIKRFGRAPWALIAGCLAAVVVVVALWVALRHSNREVAGSRAVSAASVPQAPADPFPSVPAGAFNGPIAMYRDYAVRQLGTMEGDVGRLAGALASGNRDEAKSAWRRAFADYLSLGAVYVGGRMAELDQAIDGTSAGITGGTASPKFTGLHRLEFGLWTNRSLASLKPWARTLADDVAELRHELPRLEITPTDYVTRAHEILEDALRDQLTGVDVPWSGEGVLGASAALAATTEVVRTLASLLSTSQGPREAVDSALRGLRSTITTLRARHGGVVPTVARLSQSEHERLDASVGGALTALAQVPASLEVEGTRPTQTPTIPAAASRADR